jgi:hypothetical protein
MNVPSLRRPSPSEDHNEDSRKKGRSTEGSSASASSPISNLASTPVVLGDFFRPCGGGPSINKLEEGGYSSDSSDRTGCFGMRIGFDNRPHKKADDEDDPTAVIAQAMTDLSVQEREQALEDTHGVSAMVQETPELIAKTLHEMEQCLQNINHKPVYDLAFIIRADYVCDPKLRLMFLRTDRFDAKVAAKKLIKFLEWKLKIFGQEKLCQWHVGLDDLSADARFMVESGLCQVLPERDSRGRAITITASSYMPRLYRNPQSILQLTYYFCMTVAEDEANQINGVVSVLYSLGEEKPETNMTSQIRFSTLENTMLTFCMPLRYEAAHICSPPSGIHFTLNWVFKAAGAFQRARFRAHFGSHMEIEYGLLSFGVPSHLLPFTTEGQLKTGNHKKWIQRRIIMDHEISRGNVFTGIELPRSNDVLLGKGRPIQNCPGNRRLIELAERYLDEYDQASSNGRRPDVARKIIHEFLYPSLYGQLEDRMDNTRGKRGRFLQRREDHLNSGWWEEVTDEQIMIVKAFNVFRGIRKRNVILAARVRA